jgi:hypothetical protein
MFKMLSGMFNTGFLAIVIMLNSLLVPEVFFFTFPELIL